MLGSLALTVTAAVVGWDLGQGCGKFEECPNGANENMGSSLLYIFSLFLFLFLFLFSFLIHNHAVFI